MNADLKDSFSRIKPVCDVVMVCPTQESITNFVSRVTDLKKEVVQELQQYLLFPFITHIKSSEIENKFELQCKLVDGMRIVLEKVTVNSFEMCMKIETSLLQLVFDNSKIGMIGDVPEELKLSVMRCLTVLMLNIEKRFREKLLKTQVPLIAQAVFVAVHIAKLEKLRVLRLAAINCVTAHTVTHPQLTTDIGRVTDPVLEAAAVDMLASILPGVLAALQDVATCPNNPGHTVVVASLDAIHRILCLTMSDRFLSKKPDISAEDFAKSFRDTVQFYSQEQEQKEVSCKEAAPPKEVPKRSAEWYRMASDKLTVITKSLISLRSHEHFKVRGELAIFCSRVLNECTLTMQPSQPIVLDILITLAKDDFPAVSEYCSSAVDSYFEGASFANRHRVMDNLCENFFVMLHGLPRVLNNIDSDRKLSALNLLHGYVCVLCDTGRPQRLTAALSAHHNMRALTNALAAAATPRVPPRALARRAASDVSSPPPTTCPWSKLLYLDSPACEARLKEICALLGEAESAELILDRLLEMFQQERSAELVSVMNWMIAGTTSESFISRVLDTYIEEDVWYAPLEVTAGEEDTTGTLDVSVYNPRAWTTDRVPGLYEGTVETRYTGISYRTPRARPARAAGACASAAEAQRNVLRCCLHAAGLGAAATQLRHNYQRHLMTTLCLLLERAGSKYELLHLAGVKALADVASARGLTGVPALIQHNADYFTHQVTVRLKRAWKTQSALEILSVVMEYSDPSLLDCLYGIVRDVLVQSCDKYYENNLSSYLQVFLNFVECVRKWFPVEEIDNKINKDKHIELELVNDLLDHVKNKEEAERLMSTKEFEQETGRSVEDMYQDDLKNKEDDVLEYDDRVTDEKPPLPQHVEVTLGVLGRAVHFLSAPRDDAVLALRLLQRGLPLLQGYDDQLLPLVHQAWGPLAARFTQYEPVVQRHALRLLTTMAALAKDFLHARCVKEVLPHIYKYLRKSAQDSLKESSTVYSSTLACALQAAALRALPALAADLRLRGAQLADAMGCAQLYLSSKQPKMLQELAVEFFVAIFNYDDGATWYHLRTVCNNREVLEPPPMPTLKLEPVVGTPFVAENQDLNANINTIINSIFPSAKKELI